MKAYTIAFCHPNHSVHKALQAHDVVQLSLAFKPMVDKNPLPQDT